MSNNVRLVLDIAIPLPPSPPDDYFIPRPLLLQVRQQGLRSLSGLRAPAHSGGNVFHIITTFGPFGGEIKALRKHPKPSFGMTLAEAFSFPLIADVQRAVKGAAGRDVARLCGHLLAEPRRAPLPTSIYSN